MKRQTLIVCSAVAIVYLFSPAKAFAEDYTWTDNGDGTCTITHYIGPGGAVTIPGTITGLTVTRIGNSAFRDCTSLTSMTIHDSVTYIGFYAFSGCSSLTRVTIPDGVSSIGHSVFKGCSSLTSVTIPDGITSIGSSMFDGCSSLTNVTIPDSVTRIYDSAFRDCTSLTSVIIHNSVTFIGLYAFSGCSSLLNITVDAANPSYFSVSGVLFDKSQTTLIQYPGGKAGNYTIPGSITSIGNSAFRGCTGLTGITIPDSVTSIGNSAFLDCSGLTGITIPDGVTSLGSSTFYGCTSLNIVTIGHGIASIGYSAFNHCSSLSSITIPDSVTSIDDYAFYYCTSLTSITIPDSVTSIGNSAFSYCSNLASILIGNGITTIGDFFYGCNNLTNIEIGSGVTSISNSVLRSSNLTNIIVSPANSTYSSIEGVLFNKSQTTLVQYPRGKVGSYTVPDTVPVIGDWAFSYCDNLTSVVIPDSVTGIGYEAFYRCENLTSIRIGASVTNIGDGAFYSCYSIATVTIPESVTDIGQYAFRFCESLVSVTFGESVTSIGAAAFSDCYRLVGFYFKGTPPTLGSHSSLSTFNDNTIIYYLARNAANWPETFGGLPTAVWPLSVADLDMDGEVKFNDFVLFAGQWLNTNCDELNLWCQGTDFNCSGSVDTLDLSEFASEWLYGTSIAEHVFEIEVSLSYDFGEGYGSSVPEDYQFDAWMQVDNTVVAGTLQTPRGVVYPAELEVDDGENWLGVYAASDSLADLSDFTDGEYIFTVTYANGKSQSTSILFALADCSPIAPVDQPLVVTYPLHNAADVPLTINVEMAPLNNPNWTYGIWCEPVDDDSALSGEIDDLPFDTTTAGPLELSPDTLYEMEITVNHAIWSTNEDGIPYVIDKDSEVEILFTTVSTL